MKEYELKIEYMEQLLEKAFRMGARAAGWSLKNPDERRESTHLLKQEWEEWIDELYDQERELLVDLIQDSENEIG